MDETTIVIMIKNKETGFLEQELGSYTLKDNEIYLVNAFALEEDGIKVHLKLSCDREVEDWEFDAIYDYYDEEAFAGVAEAVFEIEDCHDPTWEVVLPFTSSEETMEAAINETLEIHRRELQDVYASIAGKKEEY